MSYLRETALLKKVGSPAMPLNFKGTLCSWPLLSPVCKDMSQLTPSHVSGHHILLNHQTTE